MGGVIFSGNGGRPARNHAEVSVVIDNGDHSAGRFQQKRHFRVSRRIMRERGSTFGSTAASARARRQRAVRRRFGGRSLAGAGASRTHRRDHSSASDQRRRLRQRRSRRHFGLHVRRHEAGLRLKAAEHNLARVGGGDRTARGQGRVARDPGAAGRALSQYLQPSAAHGALLLLRWTAASSKPPGRAHQGQTIACAERTSSKQSPPPDKRKSRPTGLAREAEARAAAALASARRSRRSSVRKPWRRADRRLDRRLAQYASDLQRSALSAGAAAALGRLDTERRRSRTGAGERGAIERCNDRLAGAEARRLPAFGELTGALADLTARRQLKNRLARHGSAPALSGRLAISRRPRRFDSGAPDLAAGCSFGAGASGARATPRCARRGSHSHARDGSALRARRSRRAEGACSGSRTEPGNQNRSFLVKKQKNLGHLVMDAQRQEGRRRSSAPHSATIWTRRSSVSTDALGGRSIRQTDFARRRAPLSRLCAGAGRAGAAACADRRCRARRRARPGGLAQAGSAARHARRRLLALGRLCRRGACTDRRGAAARRARPAGCDRDRTDDGAHRNGE